MYYPLLIFTAYSYIIIINIEEQTCQLILLKSRSCFNIKMKGMHIMDDMVSEIQKFCEMYEGTAIGEETKHRLDNAEGNEEAIENIFMALKEDGWI